MADIENKDGTTTDVDLQDTTDKVAHDTAGYAVVEQSHVIPSTGERKITTKWEYHLYCLFSWGDTGVGVGNFASALQQDLVQTFFASGFMHWGGSNISTTTFLLDCTGFIFAIQIFLLLFIAPYADYGTWRPWILIVWTLFGVISSLVFFGLTRPDQWALASGFYILGNVCYNITYAFYQAAFPALVKDLPKVVESEQALIEGTTTPEKHAALDTLERSKLANISSIYGSVGSCLSILVCIGIAKGVGTATAAQNIKGYSIIVGFFGIIWLVSCAPWFIVEQHRPGQKLPDGTSWLTVGPKQIWEAARNVTKLKETFIFLCGYFLVADCYNTSGTIVNFLQNDAIAFDVTTYCGLFALVYGLSVPCYALNMYVQAKFGIHPKWLFVFAGLCIAMTNLWGIIGIYTNVIGYHHVWEFWLYQVWLGITTAGWSTYGQTMMAEVSPAPKMYIFFALYNTVGKTAGFVGPYVSGAIITDAHGVQQQGLWFTFFTCLIGCALVAWVDTGKAKKDNAAYLEKERQDLYASYGEADVKREVETEQRRISVAGDSPEIELH